VWDLVSDAGGKAWVCGSMNVQYEESLNGWVLPDPWTVKVSPRPADELAPYFKFVSRYVTDYTSNAVRLTPVDHARFVSFMLRHGLSFDTVKAIATQLLGERLDKSIGWKRAAILDRLQFDVFAAVYRRLQPQFSTLFLNSTAHFQHVYWRDMEPEQFQIQPEPQHRAAHEKSILFGYQAMDRIVGQTLDLAGPDVSVGFCTGLSQQPCTIYEEKGGKSFFRPLDFAAFLAAIGVLGKPEISPVMSQQFQIDLDSEEAALDAEAKLKALQLPERGGVMYVSRKGRSVFTGCTIAQAVAPGTLIHVLGSDRTIPFFDLFYKVDMLKSGMHHTDGMFWIRSPQKTHFVHPDKVPLVSVAPTLLQRLGLPQPASMKSGPIELPQRRVA
jgi:hypothetical protein